MVKELTCVVCPAGCKINVTLDESGKITDISGYTCIRGKNYAQSEVTHPVRTLTSTIPVITKTGEHMLPVKTSTGIPKELIFDGMKKLKKIKLTHSVKAGDIIVHGFLGTDADIVAGKDLK